MSGGCQVVITFVPLRSATDYSSHCFPILSISKNATGSLAKASVHFQRASDAPAARSSVGWLVWVWKPLNKPAKLGEGGAGWCMDTTSSGSTAVQVLPDNWIQPKFCWR